MKYISDEQREVLSKNLENVSKEIEISTNGVTKVKSLGGCLHLEFGRNEAIDSLLVDIDERSGEYFVSLGSWSAVTSHARKSIESKRFVEARSAVGYAIRTATTINNFFKQF